MTKKTKKLRPSKNPKRSAKHGIYSLEALLKSGDLDARTVIAKARDKLEAQWVTHCGGKDRLSPGMLSLIKRIVHQELLLSHAEKMTLMGKYQPDANFQARVNSQRLNILALERMIAENRGKKVPTIDEILSGE